MLRLASAVRHTVLGIVLLYAINLQTSKKQTVGISCTCRSIMEGELAWDFQSLAHGRDFNLVFVKRTSDISIHSLPRLLRYPIRVVLRPLQHSSSSSPPPSQAFTV